MRYKVMVICFSCLVFACSESPSPQQAFYAGKYDIAYDLWQEEAAVGDINAVYYLGVMHYLGLGVRQDNRMAYQYFLRASREGHPAAQRDLGLMYESGRAGERDLESAYMWLFAAYQQGNPNAEAVLKMLAGQLSPNKVRQLKQTVRPYITNDIIDPEDDDY